MDSLPALVKILSVFFGMLGLTRLKVPLGAALIVGGLALPLWAGLPPAELPSRLLDAFGSPFLWLFLAVTALVVEFGRHMARPDNAAALLALSRRLGGRHGRLCSLAALPALVGLVPMPAGALFSAPMVQQSVPDAAWNPDWKAAVNYWFRHIWEYWWPIYPAIIIGMAIFNMETWQFMATLIAYTPVSVALGYWRLLRPHRAALAAPSATPAGNLRQSLRVILPLGVIIAAVLILPPVLEALWPRLDAQVRKMLAMLAGMLAGLGLIAWEERGRDTGLFRSIVSWHSWNVLLIVGGVAIFQSLLESSGLVPVASRELLNSGLPVVPVIALLPFLAGFVTGASAGFAGIAFPLVVGLLTTPGSGLHPMATLALAFGFGFLGMMLSPIHLCLLVTRDYFAASLLSIYRHILPCALGLAAFGVCLFALLHALGW